MKGWACIFMAHSAFLAGVLAGGRLFPASGSIGLGNKIINCFDAKHR